MENKTDWEYLFNEPESISVPIIFGMFVFYSCKQFWNEKMLMFHIPFEYPDRCLWFERGRNMLQRTSCGEQIVPHVVCQNLLENDITILFLKRHTHIMKLLTDVREEWDHSHMNLYSIHITFILYFYYIVVIFVLYLYCIYIIFILFVIVLYYIYYIGQSFGRIRHEQPQNCPLGGAPLQMGWRVFVFPP